MGAPVNTAHYNYIREQNTHKQATKTHYKKNPKNKNSGQKGTKPTQREKIRKREGKWAGIATKEQHRGGRNAPPLAKTNDIITQARLFANFGTTTTAIKAHDIARVEKSGARPEIEKTGKNRKNGHRTHRSPKTDKKPKKRYIVKKRQKTQNCYLV